MKFITIDGDLYDDVKASKRAIAFTLRFLDFLGIRAVWYLNEKYSWTKTYKAELNQILKRGDEIGLHVHKINEDMRAGRTSSVQELVKVFGAYKRKLEKATGKQVLSFRSGAHAYTSQMFIALEKLGFKIDSSVVPREIVYVDKTLYPDSRCDIYVDNRHIQNRIHHIGDIIEIPNTKWKYFHPTDLMDEQGRVKIKNVIKYAFCSLI